MARRATLAGDGGGAANAVMPKFAPMLATLASDLPGDPENWAFEYKWDGVRAICYLDPRPRLRPRKSAAVKMISRNDIDMASRYPELVEDLGKSLSGPYVLDGEIIALDEKGRPSFQALQARMHVADAATIARRAKTTPVVIMLFDLLYADGELLIDRPWTERRARLEALKLPGRWQVPPAYPRKGKTLYDAAKRMEMEGVICKRMDSLYIPGARSAAWLKVKVHQRQEVVIGGYLAMKGMGPNSLGALLVGYYRDNELHYAGKVGTGFNNAERERLVKLMKPLRRTTSPFDHKPRYPEALFVEPKLVAEVEFTEWTRGGALRHPSYKGLREDKAATEVVREG